MRFTQNLLIAALTTAAILPFTASAASRDSASKVERPCEVAVNLAPLIQIGQNRLTADLLFRVNAGEGKAVRVGISRGLNKQVVAGRISNSQSPGSSSNSYFFEYQNDMANIGFLLGVQQDLADIHGLKLYCLADAVGYTYRTQSHSLGNMTEPFAGNYNESRNDINGTAFTVAPGLGISVGSGRWTFRLEGAYDLGYSSQNQVSSVRNDPGAPYRVSETRSSGLFFNLDNFFGQTYHPIKRLSLGYSF